MIGTTLGTYRIVGTLGVGGMGEVYRALDVKLGREVALKILPAAFSADPDRRARFDREAKTLAALNHPNIAQIYGVEDSTEIRALVMELVEGPTLAEWIDSLPVTPEAERGHARPRDAEGTARRGGGAPRNSRLDDSLQIARQIADALAAAHEQGVIHRDLKPANIKLRPDGTIKVLDFGLAKLTPTEGTNTGNIEVSQSPTMTLGATQAGMILGTAAYMSPEQAKGRVADKRSDVWAFGCVLFELVTGQRAFQGEDLSDVLASVLKSEPDWSVLPEDLPDAIDTLLRRCLVKDRRLRVADVAVIQFVLAEAGTLTAASSVVAAAAPDRALIQPQIDAAVSKARGDLLRRRVWPMAAIAVLGAGGLVAAAYAWLSPAARTEPVTRLTIPQATNPQNPGKPAISPDGRSLAYMSDRRLYVRRLSEFEAKPLLGVEVAPVATTNLTYSPDGNFIAFHADGAIRRVAVGDGTPMPLCPVQVVSNMTWHASGILFSQSTGILRCRLAGGEPEQLVTAGADENLFGPQMLPNGDSLLFTVARGSASVGRWDEAAVVIHSIRTGVRKTLFKGGSDARYVSTGHILYAVGGVLLARPFDVDREMITGEPVAVIEGVRRPTSSTAVSGVAFFAVSDTGTLVYYPGPVERASAARSLALADRAGAVTSLALPPQAYGHVRASRDGKRLAMDSDDGKDAAVWVHDVGSAGAPRRLTFGGRNRYPIWSPGGDRIAFQSDREGDAAIWAQPVDGTGVVRLTTPEKGQEHQPESWSPDGQHLAYSVIGTSGPALWVLSLADGKSSPFGDVRSVEPTGAAFSPDGRWLAYHVLPPGAGALSPGGGVFVEPFPRTGQLFQAPRVSRDFHPVWSQDGRDLFYIPSALSREIAATRVTTAAGVTFSAPESLPAAVTDVRTSGMRRAFDVFPGGRFVGLISTPNASAAPSELRVVINWFEELRAHFPAGR